MVGHPKHGLAEVLRSIFQTSAGLQWVYLFGSAVDSETFSDVDLAVMPEEGGLSGLVETGRLISLLESGLHEAGLGVPVDWIDLREAALPLLGSILAHSVVVLDRAPPKRTHWEAVTQSQWLDFEPAWREQERIRLLALRDRARTRERADG